jgi:dTDP-4-dehydrorhamnose 3,5-epimerase
MDRAAASSSGTPVVSSAVVILNTLPTAHPPIHPGVVKGWHKHREMTLNYACIVGRIKLVVYDPRPDSPTRGHLTEIFLGPDSYSLSMVPPDVWNGFKCMGDRTAIVANCCTHAHDDSLSERMDPFASPIEYDWSVRCH